MAWNSILFHQYFCLSLWDSCCPYCEKLRSTRSLTKTKATVSFGLTLQPGPCVPKICTYRCDLLFNASFQNSKPLRHFPFINQKQGTQKSVGFLFSNENHTKVWTDLNCLIWVAHLWYLYFSNEGWKKMLPEENCLHTCCQTAFTEKQWELCSR